MPPTPSGAQHLHQVTGYDTSSDLSRLGANEVKSLNSVLFLDRASQWNAAVKKLKEDGVLKDAEGARMLLRTGMASFGILDIKDSAIECLVQHFIGDGKIILPSAGLKNWLDWKVSVERLEKEGAEALVKKRSVAPEPKPGFCQRFCACLGSICCVCCEPRSDEARAEDEEAGEWQTFDDIKSMKYMMAGVVLLFSAMYAIFVVNYQYSRNGAAQWVAPNWYNFMPFGAGVTSTAESHVYQVFGFPVYIARGGAMGAVILTFHLYSSMSRWWNKILYRFLPSRSFILTIFDGHKEMHIYAGKMLFWVSLAHVFAHMMGSVPGMTMWTDTHENQTFVNGFMGCAQNQEDKYRIGGVSFAAASKVFAQLTWDSCPVGKITSRSFYFSFTGITGMMLTLLLVLIFLSAQKSSRTSNFDRFYYLHMFAVFAWPILLVLHGARGRLGLGMPLVFLCMPPMLMYLWDWIQRRIQFELQLPCWCCRRRRWRTVSAAVVRPGPHGGGKGSLTYLQVEIPSLNWDFRPGMYAFLCMPHYAPLQWHPFTICSGRKDHTVDFLIQGVGDWTEELANRCLLSMKNQTEATLPPIAMNGPFPAPAQSALSKQILVGFGAGVGITPFLSLLSTIVSLLDDDDLNNDPPLLESHFYWTSRNIDEFLFAQKLLVQAVQSRGVANKVFLHLHCTMPTPEKDGPAWLFREAVRRQSEVDRKLFSQSVKSQNGLIGKIAGPGLPWTWYNTAKQDIFWVSHLTGHIVDEAVPADDTLMAKEESWPKQLRRHMTTPMTSEDSTMPRAGSHTSPTLEAPAPKSEKREVERLLPPEAARSPKPKRSGCARLCKPRSDEDEDDFVWPEGQGVGALFPVTFGRPDMEAELRSIGMRWLSKNINIYICGGQPIVRSVKDVCERLNKERWALNQSTSDYVVKFERFG